MSHLTREPDVADWRRIAYDPTAIALSPVRIDGISPVDHDIVIRVLITREHADQFLGPKQLRGMDVLILSASCWRASTGLQVDVDETLFRAHIIHLLSHDHLRASFDYTKVMSRSRTRYRLVLIDDEHQPVPAALHDGGIAFLKKSPTDA